MYQENKKNIKSSVDYNAFTQVNQASEKFKWKYHINTRRKEIEV